MYRFENRNLKFDFEFYFSKRFAFAITTLAATGADKELNWQPLRILSQCWQD